MMDIKKLCETYDTLYSKLSAELQKNGYDCAIVDELSEGIIGKLNNKIDDTYLPFLEYITQTNRPYHDAFTSSNLLRLLQSSNTAFGLTCGVEAPLALMSIYLVDGTLTVATYYFARSSEEAEDDSMCDSGYKIGIQCVQGAVSTVTERIGSKSAYQPSGSSVRNSIAGKTIVVTGDLVNFPEPGPYPQRVAFRKFVESHGGKLTSSISGKTSYLVCNDQSSGTTKVQQAKEKGTPILTEKEFLEMVGVAPTPAPAVIPWDFKIQNGVLTKYRGHDRMVVIPGCVTTIGEYAFNSIAALQSVVIPNSVTTLDYCAFCGCTNLQSITIPDSVTTIGSAAFVGCTGLRSITIPDSVTTIDWDAFEGCTGLQSITIPNSVTTIGRRAFEGCTGLQSITIPNSITTIDKFVFDGCINLQSITIPNSVTTIGEHAFRDCKCLQSVTIPDSVTTIDRGAFEGCSSLQSITIPNSVTTIGWWAFEGCSSLQSITIPDSVTIIGVGAFSGCKRLRSVAIPNSVTTLGGHAFFNCTHLETITIPEGITAIKAGTFKRCAKLKFVFLPTSVATIDQEAFQECDNLQFIFAPGVPFGDFTETKFKILAAIGYMQNCGAYKDTDNKALYEKYISSQKKRMLVVIFQHDIVQAVEYLEKAGKITNRNYEKDFLIPAQQAGATQCVDFLLKWKASMA